MRLHWQNDCGGRSLPLLFAATLLLLLPRLAYGDIGIIAFWVPDLYALLEQIQLDGNAIEAHVFSGRRFYVTRFKGHNIVALNSGEGMANSAAATAILLQKFPAVDRIVGTGIAGGVNPSLRLGDVVVPERWALYQESHFARVLDDGTHRPAPWANPTLMGSDCGLGSEVGGSTSCQVGVNTWNFTFMYPIVSYGADPTNDDPTIEKAYPRKWYNVDPEMFAIAQDIAPNITLMRGTGNALLDYDPIFFAGGNGVSGSAFVDNAEYREYLFDAFNATAVDMETSAVAHVAEQFGVKYIFFRSLSDLAGGEDGDNALQAFFGVAAVNAVAALSAFMGALPPDNKSVDEVLQPMDHAPGEDTPGLLGVLSFYAAELRALKNIMSSEDSLKEIVFGGRRFYRGTIAGADVVATLTGVSTSNSAMTTALMLQLFPGVERIIGGGIAGGVDPSLRVGDVVIPERWAMYQYLLLAKEPSPGVYELFPFERNILVGRDCGAFDGVASYLNGDGPCNAALGETSNFGIFFPKTSQTPDPASFAEINRISEGPTRKWWFEADPFMLEVARAAVLKANLSSTTADGSLPYTPEIRVGGNGVSGPSFIDNAEYRSYIYREFDARCVDMESAAAAQVASQNGVPFLFFRSLSNLAGADVDENTFNAFIALAADNAFAVTFAVIQALYQEPGNTSTATPSAPTSASSSAVSLYSLLIPALVCWGFLFNNSG